MTNRPRQPPAASVDERSVDSPAADGRADRPVILVTGASSGIGLAVARRFASRGWRVFASMRRPEKGEALLAEARAAGWALDVPTLDVTDDASVAGAVSGLLAATGGRLDVVLNNAGYYVYGPLEETTPDELRAQLETNLIGVHRVTRAVLPALRAQGRGRILVIGSVSGLVALPAIGPYQASKWAIEAWTETLRYEVSPWGIRVALIEPGPFQTALHDNEVRAGAAGSPDSPYAGLLAAYHQQSRRMPRAELPALVDVIERAATTARPRLRWPVGPNSFAAAYLRRLVPDRIYELVVGLVFRRRAH